MKLKNKKTGEIVEFRDLQSDYVAPLVFTTNENGKPMMYSYNSLAELTAEWCDYEEPKVGYIVDPMEEDCVSEDDSGYEESDVEKAKELSIWFETKEEAEKAVRKLKAWKRLKDKGLKFELCPGIARGEIKYYLTEESDETEKDLRICFGGEE